MPKGMAIFQTYRGRSLTPVGRERILRSWQDAHNAAGIEAPSLIIIELGELVAIPKGYPCVRLKDLPIYAMPETEPLRNAE